MVICVSYIEDIIIYNNNPGIPDVIEINTTILNWLQKS